MPRFVDLSHIVEDGLVTYPGLPAVRITEHLGRAESRQRYAAGTEFHIGRIDMVANTGTYVDAPFHRFAQGKDLADLPLRSVADLPGLVVRAPRGSRAVDADRFAGLDLAGRAVLVHTGWSSHWGTEQYFDGHAFLTEAAAERLRDGGAACVGIDSLNIDDTAGGHRPVHTMLLEAEIPVIEHLCGLEDLPDHGFRFFAVPVRVRGMGTFPVRAFAVVG